MGEKSNMVGQSGGYEDQKGGGTSDANDHMKHILIIT